MEQDRSLMTRVVAMTFTVLSSCQTPAPPSLEAPHLAVCDPAVDAECLLKKTSADEYESREQVMAKEATREADAFQSRLDRWRSEEDARQRARATSRTSTPGHAASGSAENGGKVENADEEETDGRLSPEDPVGAALAPEDPTRDGFGSSIRALEASAKASDGADGADGVDRADGAVGAHGGSPPRDARDASERSPRREAKSPTPAVAPTSEQGMPTPTPATYLRGAKCLLIVDLTLMKKLVSRERGQRARAQVAELALSVVEAQALAEAIDAELEHRREPQGLMAMACREGRVLALTEPLRKIVGAAPQSAKYAAAYARGLGRLREELEVRAGLPRSP